MLGFILGMFLYYTRPYIQKLYGVGYDSDTNSVLYYKNNCQYIVKLKNKNKPSFIFSIKGGLNERFTCPVTGDVLPFMGPSYDFHGIETTPKMLGYHNLEFMTYMDETYHFDSNDIIKFT